MPPPTPERATTGRRGLPAGRTGDMCHDTDSRPPAPPRSGDVAERGTLTLTSTDGTPVAAAYAAPARAAGGGGVRLADVRREVAAGVFGGHPGPADAAADT